MYRKWVREINFEVTLEINRSNLRWNILFPKNILQHETLLSFVIFLCMPKLFSTLLEKAP